MNESPLDIYTAHSQRAAQSRMLTGKNNISAGIIESSGYEFLASIRKEIEQKKSPAQIKVERDLEELEAIRRRKIALEAAV